jgi:hypothetical protein
MSALLKRFKKTASVTRNLLKIEAGKEYAIRFTGEMHIGKEMPPKIEADPITGEIKKIVKQPAYVAFVDNLDVPETNTDGYEEMQTIISTVMRKEMIELYPDHGYVGKCFVFSQVKIERGYNVPQITEIEDPDPARSAQALADWKAAQAKKTAEAKPSESAETNTAQANAAPDKAAKGKK